MEFYYVINYYIPFSDGDNMYMGGTDLGDAYRASKFSIALFSRKWTTVLFFNLLQMAVVNAFIIYKALHPGTEHFTFVQDLVNGMLANAASLDPVRKKKKDKCTTVEANEWHICQRIEVYKVRSKEAKDYGDVRYRTRECAFCRAEGILTKKGKRVTTTFQCSHCTQSNGNKVPLCAGCFEDYHNGL